jgi:hypothetical protein
VPKLSFIQYLLGMVLGSFEVCCVSLNVPVAIGYPCSAVMVFALYSKLLGAGRQGLL